MGVYLHKTGYQPAVADPDTGEIVTPAGNTYEKVVGELEELREDFIPVTLGRETSKAVTVLLDRIKFPWESPFRKADGSYALIEASTLDSTGLVPSFCEHGLAEHPVTGKQPWQARSWVLSRLLTVIRGTHPPQVACHCLCAEQGFEGCKAEAKGERCPARGD